MSKRLGDPGYAAGWCIHYRSPGYGPKELTTCEAGVAYADVREKGHAGQPCFLDQDGQSRRGAVHCDHLRRPTPEEIAAHHEWRSRRMSILVTVMVGIEPWRLANQGRNHAEVVECPACKGRLHLTIVASNGHVHGRCETGGCASWME